MGVAASSSQSKDDQTMQASSLSEGGPGSAQAPLLSGSESDMPSTPGTPWPVRQQASLSANGMVFAMGGEEGEEEGKVTTAGATLRGTIFNAVNGILGGGILALPFSLKQDGTILGAIMIVMVAALGERSLLMLLYCADQTRSRLYAQIGDKLLGWRMSKAVDLTVLLQNFGLCTGYVVILGDLLPSIMTDFGAGGIVTNRTFLLCIVSGAIFLPLSALPKLDFLRHTSLLAMLFVMVLVITTTALGIHAALHPASYPNPATRHEPMHLWPAHDTKGAIGFLQSVPIVFFSFVVHNTALLLYGELRRRGREGRGSRWGSKRNKMLDGMRVALVLCATLYILQSVFGYSLFRAGTLQDVLKNFTHSSFPWFVWIKLAYALVIIFSFPVIAIALRQSVHNFGFAGVEPTHWHRIGQAIGIALATAVVGITVPKVSVVFGLTGSLTATNVMYCFPAAFFLLLRLKHGAPQEFVGDIPVAILVFIVGAAVCIGSTVGIIYGLVE